MTTTSTAALLLALAALVPMPASGQGAEASQPASVRRYVPPTPTPDGFIRDVPGVLDATQRRQLNARIATIQAQIHGDIGVAILADIGDIEPYELGTAIYRSWKIGTVAPIGNARRNVGALVLLVPKELAPNHRGQCWITTGWGSEGAVVDGAAGSICRDRVIPAMQARNYSAAVDSAITGIEHLYLVGLDSLTAAQELEIGRATASRAVSAESRGVLAGTKRTRPFLLVLFGVGLIGVVYVVVRGIGHYLRYRPRACPKGHGPMRLLSESEDDLELEEGARFEEQIGSVNYDIWRCLAPGCSERLVIPRTKWWSGYADCDRCHRRAVTSSTVTLVPATQASTGLEECTTTCAYCKATHTTRHVTPMLPTPASSSSSSGFSSGGGSGSSFGGSGGSSFGGSGSTSGGGGGASY
jgi:uncharacterized protein